LTLAYKLGIDVAGVDLSEPGIKLANERARSKSLNAVFTQGAVEDYQGPKFDMITLFEAIEHFTDVDKVMEVIKAHLKPGGTLLVSTPDAEGFFGIRNAEDICHLIVWTHRPDGELPTSTPEGKPIRSLPDYLESQGFTIVENEVYNDLINVRATV
jgi:2-polyprenyl-3-methyl-5-hydroxy-6-metoxy-1,4-benzoquinol methylase